MVTPSADDAPLGVVGVGASAGGVEALKQFAAGLPPDLRQAVLVVLHVAPSAPSVLGQILDRSGPLPAAAARDGEPLRAGRLYVAVPDRHMLVEDGRIVLSGGPTEDRHRPAINPLMRSLALSYGPKATGIVMSGVLDDGVLGLQAIRSRGGVTMVQDPDDALYPDMPRNALAMVDVQHTVSAAGAGALLKSLEPSHDNGSTGTPDPVLALENEIAMGPPFGEFDVMELGVPSGHTCPDCSGSLVSIGDGNLRCRIGHAWTPEALLEAWTQDTENALGVALRSLLEKAQLARSHAKVINDGVLSSRYLEIAEEADSAASELRKLLGSSSRVWGKPRDPS
ncbi:chemotaxis protein CheB [Mycolicibacterium sediminis]|uniref:protein-glutamate methylesterase n=1 Tax=Mycolicibacterium sediminis TaxID=1286180 RepID=A0A7I7QP55_9MYCO|nr:chemotaxis protein CheB [Mycolicibacterium sediminis]BBY27992.1 chemotaxis protein CheB [Mycolicibacterium sediminis]